MSECPVRGRAVAVTGCSGSGKSTLVAALLKDLSGDIAVLPLDAYYRDLSHLTLEARESVNYDHPDALDMAQYAHDLGCLKRGQSVEIPRYDFTQHTRFADGEWCHSAPWVLGDGILLMAEPTVAALFDFVVFVETPLPVCFERRLCRDVQQRGRTPDSVRAFWDERAQPMFEVFGEMARQQAHLVVSGEVPVEQSAEQVLAAMSALYS
jgi:uridine kinase